MYFVYILKCSDNSLYTGITSDLERRIKEHDGLLPGGAKYTSSRRPVELLYFEKCEDRSEATKRELQIKKMTKLKKIKLISEKNF
ncbi:GIY-YIG nuclease family protein [Candidatus Gracilibacteria bacterium]|nr:MAG: GIY-YIG nuclease family protein [Candidatus Gracilibacteria bacterium]